MPRLSALQSLVAFGILTGIAVGLSAAHVVATGRFDPFTLGPTFTLVGMGLLLPFLLRDKRQQASVGSMICSGCAITWNPRLAGIAFCPGCGKHPKVATSLGSAAPTRR